VGTTAGPLEGALCMPSADSVPAFIKKKDAHITSRLNVGILFHYITVFIYQKIVPVLNLQLDLH